MPNLSYAKSCIGDPSLILASLPESPIALYLRSCRIEVTAEFLKSSGSYKRNSTCSALTDGFCLSSITQSDFFLTALSCSVEDLKPGWTNL